MHILLKDPPLPLAHTLFEALRCASTAAPVTQSTGLFRVAILLHRLRFVSFFGPSHDAWLRRCPATHRQSRRSLPKLSMLRAWRDRHPTGNPSPGPLKALSNLRRHQAKVIAQWHSRFSQFDPPPWILAGPLCECGDAFSSVPILLVCPKYPAPRAGLFAGRVVSSSFEDIPS